MRKIPALLSFVLLAAPLAALQTPTPAPSPTQGQASPTLQKEIEEAIQLVQSGKKDAAFAKLQAIQKDPAVSRPVLSLVGALYVEIDRPKDALAVLKPLADAEDAQPAVLYNAGRAALRAGQVDDARVYWARSLFKQPDSPAARDLGLLTARSGHLVEAYSMLRPWALRNPSDTEARLMAADLAVQLERGDDALQLISSLPDTEPAIRLLHGKALVLKKDGPGAVALLKPLLTQHPQGMDLEIRRSLAEAELLAGQPAEAVKLLEGKAAGRPPLVLVLARAQHQAGNAAAATATLKPLADKLPPDANAVGDPRPLVGIAMEYGSLLVDGGHAAEAVPFYEKATVYHPRNPDAWKGLARALDAAGRKADAQRALAQATEMAKPAKPGAAGAPGAAPAPAPPAPAPAAPGPAAEMPLSPGLQQAAQQMSQGDLQAALTTIRQEIAVSKDPRARLIEVRVLLLLKKPDEALKAADAALATDAKNPDYIYLRGASEMALKRYGAAEKDLRKTLQLQPRHLAAMDDLAVLLMQSNKNDEARKLLQQVLQINPQDKVAASNLAQLTTEGKQ
ncbi:MAG TPA: tetratricopeptide repeat protein [Thermoanaerobaculia bacterium]|nr:tetratricopeptide repeat protein [Thermoanaerobaculia bacterium]